MLESGTQRADDARVKIQARRGSSRAGFTLLELMMVVFVIGVLEEGFYSEYETYQSATAEPAAIPGAVAAIFDGVNSDFASLGFAPEGQVYFSYGVAVSGDGSGFTADAAADIDADGFVQYWGYANSDGGGALIAGEVGCNVAGIQPETVAPCTPSSGRTVF